jgi:hypothetical protein
MAHISRPFQIALVAVGLLAAVWFVALRGHSSSTSGSGSTPAESASSAAHSTSAPSAPGVAGLTKDVEKARGAVKTSEQNATQLAQKSAQASSAQSSAAPAAPAKTAAPSAVKTTAVPSATSKPPAAAPKATPQHKTTAPTNAPARQRSVEAQLARGDIVMVLFWNNKGIDDKAVQREVVAVARSPKVAMQQATSKEAAAFGTITRGVQLYSTPTVLVINSKGQAKVITGLTDAYALRQAISDARKA